MNLNEKIRQIIIDKNISPSHFADEIGVQRSSVSHIMADRNKPSLDFVLKIIRQYPELGTDWILDEGKLPETKQQNMGNELPKLRNVKAELPISSLLDLSENKLPDTDALHESVTGIKKELNHIDSKEKTIKCIIVFHTDGTFLKYVQQ